MTAKSEDVTGSEDFMPGEILAAIPKHLCEEICQALFTITAD